MLPTPSKSSSDDGALPEDPFAAEAIVAERTDAGTGALVAMGTFWLLVQALGTKTSTLLGQIVLGWLLGEKDFGEIGMAFTVTAFVALLVNPGIDVILVRRGRRFDLWSSPAFYFSLATAMLGCIVILLCAPVAAWFYETPQLFGMLIVMAIATPIGALFLVPTAKLQSQMQFRALAAIRLFQTVLQTILTIVFAALGFGAYAFVLPVPLVYAAVAVVSWIVARPVVHFREPLRHWNRLIGDSGYLFGLRLLSTMVQQGDYIILGALYGAIVVGPYFFAYGLATQAIRLTAGSLQSVLMAGLARLPSFSHRQTHAALRATKALALFGLPLCMIQAAVTEPFLRALYGDKWIAAVPLAQLISVGMAFDVASWPAGSLLQSRGQFRFGFFWSTITAPTFLVMVFAGALYGEALGAAVAVCLFYAIFSPLLAICVFRTSDVGWHEILHMYLRPILVGALAAGASLIAIQFLAMAGLPAAWQFGVALCAGLATMLVAARWIMSSSWHEIMARLKNMFPSLTLLQS